ncbi:D-alanyl-D-alanine carboxypeptidase [Mycoplasmatota bacterium]|nr:D-alanyl-D-alanine carboxypeptidase [Mycoplasmatota bacterium]
MKKILITFLFIVLYVSSSISVIAESEIIVDAESAILIEVSTGRILYQKNAHEMKAPASMTKIMTMALILEAIENGQFSFDDLHTISENAASYGGSQIWLEEGEVMSVRDLFKSVAISSANDSATALAEKVAGSEKIFVDLMNQKVKDLGLSSTAFQDPTGLAENGDNSSAGHYSTAYDMAMMARYLIQTYPIVLEYTNVYDDYIRNGDSWLVNTNKLVRHSDIDGLKTGWTVEAKYCLTATKFNDDMRVIGVLMGSTDTKTRNAEMLTLLNYGMSNYKVHNQMEKDKIVKVYENILFEPTNIEFKIKNPANIVLRNGTDMGEVTYSININYGNLISGKDIGEMKVLYKGDIYQEILLYVDDEIKKAKYIKVVGKVISRLLGV